jgi:hypothetical protein
MAWETRGNRRFYYRSKRINGKVVKEYVGGDDPETRLIAELDRQNRAKRQEAIEAVRRTQNRLDEATKPLTVFITNLDVLVQAELLAAGFHDHRGEWRRRRANTTKTKAT